ncbi:sensor histidine kinase [Candidatus Saccharibacteria bacterium]|nr:MAG: sensor histidine kinase [Candidatus Saccharibacteria bacterium]
MLLVANLLLGFNILLAILMAGLIIISNHKKRTNQTLVLFIVAVFLWTLSNLLSNLYADIATSLFFARSTIIGAALIPLTFFIFTKSFLGESLTAKNLILSSFFPILILLTAPTELNIKSVEAYGFNSVPGLAYYALLLELVLYIGISLKKLYRRSKSTTTSSMQKSQIQYIFTGMVVSVVPAAIANAFLPLLGYNWAVYFGPSTFSFLVVFTTLAIVKHGLLDIRLIVARSLGYIFTLTTLVGAYVLAIFGLSSSFLGTGNLTGTQQILYIIATLIFGFSLSPLKRFFDKLTNRLFYRDAYDAQELLDKLNKVLVGNIDLDIILKQTSDLVATTLKAEYVAFIIRETEGTSRRASFSKLVNLNADDILALKAQKKGKTELFVADEIENDRDKQKEVMNANNIAIAAHLAGTGGTGNTGYLLLGPKQSGNPYNKQDLQVLDIIANELVIAIQNALRFEEIETFNITLQEKVDEATRQLRRTNEKLKEIDETKDEFISMASHQLRTPLTSVKGYVSMVVEGDAGKITKQQKELLDQAFASSQRMVYLIADLLNVSRLKTGKFIIENKPTPLADVIETEMQQLQDMANTKEQTLTYVKPKDFPDLNLDETKIRQVIMNFTDNALHYTPAGGHIAVNLEEKADSIEFTVVDDGLGVPKSEQHHLFGKFYRAGNAKKARPDGTGLGLFMAKKVIVAQGGAVIFKSEEGKGSTFGFTFPKKTVLAKKK